MAFGDLLVRLRISASLGLPAPLTELALRADTYTSVDVPPGGEVIWGKGLEVIGWVV